MIANTITSREDRGISEQKQTGTAVAIPVLTPDRAEKRQNGRRFKENGEEMFTLTAQDKHGVMIDVPIDESSVELKPVGGYCQCSPQFNRGFLEGEVRTLRSEQHDTSVMFSVEGIDLKAITSTTRGKVTRNGYIPTLDHNCYNAVTLPIYQKIDGFNTEADGNSMTIKRQYQQTSQANLTRHDSFGATGAIVKVIAETENEEHPDIMVKLNENCTVYAIWYEKYQCYIAIRKLTPKECFRLQGFSDEYFEKAKFVNSDSQLYKQAGNGVTTNVVRVIADRLAEIERSTKNEQL